MKNWIQRLGGAGLAAGLGGMTLLAQTAGNARLEVTLLDYNGSSAKHYTVVWVTTGSGTFIKSLRKQGPSSWTNKEWNSHCQVWNTARAGSTVLDGYSSATASSYTGTNSPVICTWNGRDAAGNLVADGPYKFWVQYAEDSGQGPVTTGGLLWTKGAAATANFPNQGANFSAMKVVWTPDAPVTTPPVITSVPPVETATVGVPYARVTTATGTAPIRFSASGLPPGLQMSTEGSLSGTPLTPGSYSGSITATNGTLPNAVQPFTITVTTVPARWATVRREGTNLVLGASGPTNGLYAILGTTEPVRPAASATPLASGTFNPQGQMTWTNRTDGTRQYYWLRVP